MFRAYLEPGVTKVKLTRETAGEKTPAYHRQVVSRWSKEGRVRRTGRGMYEKI